MKFQIYTDDGRWVGQYELENSNFESLDDYYNWNWENFFDYIAACVKEENEGAH